jgi:hypothetical protein
VIHAQAQGRTLDRGTKEELLTMIGIYIVTKNMTIEQTAKDELAYRRLARQKAP